MTPRERVWAALAGREVDRPPVSFWGHAYHRESTAADLVEATLETWRRYRWDWVKLNPRKHYHVEPWGVRYRYPGVPDGKPRLEEWPVRAPTDWARISARPPDAGALGEQLEAVRRLRRALPADVPLVETVFTPLAVLGEMVETPQELRAHLDSHPDLVRGALEAVTATFAPFVREVLRAGADGIYFATVDWASADLLTPEMHRAWSRPWDRRVLAAAADAPFNVLHVCGRRNLLFELGDYPVAAFSWAATDPTNPTLADGLARLGGAVMGGIAHDGVLLGGDEAAVRAEVEAARRATGGRRWLAAPGCSIRPATPPAHLLAARDAVASARLSSPSAPRSHGGSSSDREVRP
jgi:uroporphyrinogen decarboxylase